MEEKNTSGDERWFRLDKRIERARASKVPVYSKVGSVSSCME